MIEQVSSNKVFGGWHKQYTHQSAVLSCAMRFAVYLPPQAQANQQVPVLYWLSGLTCSDENFMQKSGAFRIAAELGIAIVAPDTSPRGAGVTDDEGYDLGQGAGFYVNATQEPWSKHYQMYDYVVEEFPALIEQHFPVSQQRFISGHSMGGHGALMIALRNPEKYISATAFSPICHPVECPWGQKAFSAYLGQSRNTWLQYDATELIAQSKSKLPMLISQGQDDSFLAEQLKPDDLMQAAKNNDYPISVEMQAGYDHSYYFISSFIEQHLIFHHQHLAQA